MTPEKLGPYLIERSIGRGGMGTVYAGTEAKTKRPAAIKVLSAALAQDEGFRDRFDAEIRSLRSLDHPNIVSLIGFGEEGGQLFYAMELIDGTSLAQELRERGRFGWQQAVRIGIETARALKHAHDRGIIHRDLKPGNLLLDPDGNVKLSDFGIARVFGNNQITSTGAVIGTAEYMAPEQADGRRVTLRCDLYSLGVVLYTLLTGRPPFVAGSMVEVLQMQRFEKPKPLSEIVGGIPRELEAIVDQLLEKDPEDRIPNADVLTRRLEALQRGMSAQGKNDRAATVAVEPDFGETQPDRQAARDLATQEGYDLADAVDPTLGESSRGDGPVESGLMPTQAVTGAATFPPGGGETLPAKKPAEPGTVTILMRSVSPGMWTLAFCILAGGLLAWYWVRPPAADPLYQSIADFIADNAVDQWYRSENEIRRFLQHHSDDPRAGELRAYLEEIELHRLGQRLARGARRQTGAQDLGPIERAYLDAVALAETDPDTAARRLQAILDLYGRQVESRDAQQLIALVERRLGQIEQRIDQAAQATLPAIEHQLDRAEELSKTDPEAARQVRKAVVDLYAGKPWASELVRRAEAALDRGRTDAGGSQDAP